MLSKSLLYFNKIFYSYWKISKIQCVMLCGEIEQFEHAQFLLSDFQ